MITKIVTIDDSSDPVFISTNGQRIELRIGYAHPGETRIVKLRITEAKKVAEELIRQAEGLAQANIAKKQLSDWRNDNGFGF